MNKPRTIKKYSNRKLYDTVQSCYVTLPEIAAIIREGSSIQVIDNRTKEDVTYLTQIKLLFVNEEKVSKKDSSELLERVIRETGTFTGFINSMETPSHESGEVVELCSELEANDLDDISA